MQRGFVEQTLGILQRSKVTFVKFGKFAFFIVLNQNNSKMSKKRTIQNSKRKNTNDYILSRKIFEADYDLTNWIVAVEKGALTLRDLKKLQKGDVVEVVCFHGNFGDEISNALDAGQISTDIAYNPVDVFRRIEKVDRYTHDNGVSGFLNFAWEGVPEIYPGQPFTFDALIRYWRSFNHEGRMTLENKSMHYTQFSKNTLVGSGGYMIPLDRLKKAPRFFINEEHKLISLD